MMETITANKLVTDNDVQETLKKDKGPTAFLTSWALQDFTKKGDNYASVVTSIISNYNQDKIATYIVKTNPCRENAAFEPYTRFQFEKEGRFYNELAEALTTALNNVGEGKLRIPKCFLVRLPLKREMIVLEDLRSKGFVMAECRKGLNRKQAILVICELARMHAASILYKTKDTTWATIGLKHDYLKKDRMNYDAAAGKKFHVMFSLILENAQEVLKKVGGYDDAINWLSEVKDNLMELYEKQLADSAKFNVICHGDCWINNILFRYNAEGEADEVILLDLQMCRIASLATDISYFLYSSLERPVRTKHMADFLSLYYDTFKSILKAGGVEVTFELSELHQELKEKTLLGAITAFTIIPATLMPEGEVLDYSNMKGGSLRDFMMLWREKMLDMVDNTPLMRPRFIEFFDELKDCGLIKVE